MKTKVKICGINDLNSLYAAIEHGADFVGLNFYPPSPRSVDIGFAREIAAAAPEKLQVVGVFVNPTEDELDHVLSEVALDMVQFHGQETPDFIAEFKENYPLPVIKALALSEKKDLDKVKEYEDVADWFLFDSKPPKNVASLPGGNALSFDWTILQGAEISRPWLLAGGLHAGNIQEAIKLSGAEAVDCASGVEDRPGHKSIEKIKEFLAAARNEEN